MALSFRPAGRHGVFGGHTATALLDGRVLIGQGPTFELWDPLDQSFHPAGMLPGNIGGYTATALSDGRVLIVGGTAPSRCGRLHGPCGRGGLASTHPVLQRRGILAQARAGHTATLLADGRVLVTGGSANDGTCCQGTASAEVWESEDPRLQSRGVAAEARLYHTATPLPDGRVFDRRGKRPRGIPGPRHSAGMGSGLRGLQTDRIARRPRSGHTASLIPDGRVLVLGGDEASRPRDEQGLGITTAEILDPRP